MAQIICPKCKSTFESNNPENFVTHTAAATALGAAGAYYGSQTGLAGGPFGAINGLWIEAGVGAGLGWFAADQFRRYPNNHIFKT